MSGEAILVPILGTTVGTTLIAGVAVGLAAGIALNRINEWQSAKRMEALESARIKRQNITELVQTEAALQSAMELAKSHRILAQADISAIEVTEVNTAPSENKVITQQAQGFLNESGSMSALILFRDTQAWLDSFEATQALHENAPLANLRSQLARLKQTIETKPDDSSALLQFIEVARATLDCYFEEQQQKASHEKTLFDSMSDLLVNVTTYEGLAQQERTVSELNGLQQSILQLLKNSEKINVKSLSMLQKKFEQLKLASDNELAHQAALTDMQFSTATHLTALGYELLEQPEPTRSIWQIPGGEQVMLDIEQNGQIKSKIIHERIFQSALSLNAEINLDELKFIRQQEQRWCSDVKEMVRRMTKEGYRYQIHFDDMMPENAIEVVVVEDIEEILETEHSTKHEQKRDLL